MGEQCQNHEAWTGKIADIDKSQAVLKSEFVAMRGEVQEMKADQMRMESKLDELPAKIAASLPKPAAPEPAKPWYIGDKAMNAAVIALVLAAAKLLEKVAAAIQ